MWLNPFHTTNHFDRSGNPSSESIYSTQHSTCNNQDGLQRSNSSGWHFWQFRNQPHPGADPAIHEPTLPGNGAISHSIPSSRFRNSQSLSSNHLEPVSHIQDPAEEVPHCSSLLHDYRPSLLTESCLDFLQSDCTFDNQYASVEAGKRKNGSLSGSLIADFTKDWSPLAVYHVDDNVRKEQTQSASIQTENINSAWEHSQGKVRPTAPTRLRPHYQDPLI
ncbi:hypothetical protein TcWFU_005284 [Taenia crassiceps]|uniref:Uncharacterized protein n=1 Tax=Taenia crassiceps TaxID=6207 RepID=A0ABR4QL51_9CEST